MTDVNLIAENGLDGHVVPERRFASQIFPSLCHVVKAPWRGDFFRVVLQGNLAERINTVIQRDETAAEGRKHKVCVLARFDEIGRAHV